MANELTMEEEIWLMEEMLNRPSRLEITPLPDDRCPSIKTPARKSAIQVVEDRALDASILMLGAHEPYDPANPGFVPPTTRPTTTTSIGKPPALLKPSYPARRRQIVIKPAPPCLVGLAKRPSAREDVFTLDPHQRSPQRRANWKEPHCKSVRQIIHRTAAWLTYDDAPLLAEYPEQFETLPGDLFATPKHPQTALERLLAALTPLDSIRRRQGTRRATFTAYDTALRLFKVTQYRTKRGKNCNHDALTKCMATRLRLDSDFISLDPDELVSYFTQQVISSLDCHAPMATRSVHRRRCPWLTQKLLLELRERDKLYKSAKRTNNRDLLALYKNKRRDLEVKLNIARDDHFKNYLEENKSGSNIWSKLKRVGLINIKQSSPLDHFATDSLNNFYAKTLTRHPSCDLDFVQNLPCLSVKKVVCEFK
ncbi:hypothetical protein KQX54_003746 [Cotesia glomerata]|uniref:Uncharacterized protein n=1 Tax=Cotesia glomerata TaxID=32391 RepID=A0AAV7J172_COTGL|nr:hypothetical protein KQX54_003746 [Cotesia glomerata]